MIELEYYWYYLNDIKMQSHSIEYKLFIIININYNKYIKHNLFDNYRVI